MAFGIMTGRAHLNARDVSAVEPQEIDWDKFITWNNGIAPTFAGRYFLGRPYLWAHGEGTEAFGQAGPALTKIAPVQRADLQRQEAVGQCGERYGFEDGRALCANIERCLDMSELSVQDKFGYVFLEVPDGTQLSKSYWASWCATVYDYTAITLTEVVVGNMKVPMPKVSQPFLPCICCRFTKPPGAAKYAPEREVTNCLSVVAESAPDKQTRCWAFWARVTDIADYHVPVLASEQIRQPALDWTIFDSYAQPQGSASQAVPILLWRYQDGADPNIPQSGTLTLEATNEAEGQASVSKLLLTLENWSTIYIDPIQFGIDRGRDVTSQIACLAGAKMNITEMPFSGNNSGIRPNSPLGGKTTFAIRYYSTERTEAHKRVKDLSLQEAWAISRAGVEVAAVWQAGGGDECDVPAHLVAPGQGFEDSWNAFFYAANRIGQPPHTPVYFAVDALVSRFGGTIQCPRGDGFVQVEVPTVAQIVAYFQDVARGYQQYLMDQKAKGRDPVPYYVGVYASSNVLDALYIRGLATHFWQAWPPRWGDDPATQPNLAVWAHDNIWQVLVWNSQPGFWGVNPAVVACAGQHGVDLNVAWGDVGGWTK